MNVQSRTIKRKKMRKKKMKPIKCNEWADSEDDRRDDDEKDKDSDIEILTSSKIKKEKEDKSTNNVRNKRRRKCEIQNKNAVHSKKRRLRLSSNNDYAEMPYVPDDNINDILFWIGMIGFEKWTNTLREHFEKNEIDSIKALKCIEITDLLRFGVTNFLDQKALLNAFKTLPSRN